MKNGLLSLMLLLLGMPMLVRAQGPDISGKWVLDLGKSQLESPPDHFRGSIFIIKKHGDQFHLSRYHMVGNKVKKIGFHLRADGKPRRLKLLFKAKLENSVNGWVASIWRKNFSNIVTYHLGSGPNEMIADEYFKSPHDAHHNIWVFKRIEMP